MPPSIVLSLNLAKCCCVEGCDSQGRPSTTSFYQILGIKELSFRIFLSFVEASCGQSHATKSRYAHGLEGLNRVIKNNGHVALSHKAQPTTCSIGSKPIRRTDRSRVPAGRDERTNLPSLPVIAAGSRSSTLTLAPEFRHLSHLQPAREESRRRFGTPQDSPLPLVSSRPQSGPVSGWRSRASA